MAEPRDGAYVWVTWITKLLAGEVNCEWAPWFRAHHKYKKVPSDFDLAQWTADHTALLRRRAQELRDEGHEVLVEGQNGFRLPGTDGTILAGKPDLVALRDGRATVIDCKTGMPKTSDQIQVLIYMIVLPHTHARCKGLTLDGEVCYTDDRVSVGADRVTPSFRKHFKTTIHQLGKHKPPARSPSYDECRFCDIRGEDCPERIETRPEDKPVEHDLF